MRRQIGLVACALVMTFTAASSAQAGTVVLYEGTVDPFSSDIHSADQFAEKVMVDLEKSKVEWVASCLKKIDPPPIGNIAVAIRLESKLELSGDKDKPVGSLWIRISSDICDPIPAPSDQK